MISIQMRILNSQKEYKFTNQEGLKKSHINCYFLFIDIVLSQTVIKAPGRPRL